LNYFTKQEYYFYTYLVFNNSKFSKCSPIIFITR